MRNLRYWAGQPIFDRDGILTIGYRYPNLFMSEKYNAPGSPYWSFKTFLALAMPQEHPFWRAEEKEVAHDKQRYLVRPHMLITHEENHALIYPVGQHCMEHGASAAKYEKFVYSNQFGFSVPRGTTLESGAFDNTLAVSAKGENFYRMRYGVERFEMTENYSRTFYHIGRSVSAESIIVPLGAWHVRIHHIVTDEAIDVADGGFAIPKEQCNTVVAGRDSGKYQENMVNRKENAIFCYFPWGISGIVGICDTERGIGIDAHPELVQAFPNTNLLHNLTVIPTLRATLEKGQHTLISCVYADAEHLPEGNETPVVVASPRVGRYDIRLGLRKVIVNKESKE